MRQRYFHVVPLSRQRGHANFLANLFNGGKPKTPADPNADPNNKKIPANPNNPNPNNNKDPNDPNNMKNAKDPNDPNNPDPNRSQKNPLDIFDGLFQTDNKSAEDTPPAFSLDQEALTKLVGKMNFSGQLTPELLDKLKSGDAQTTTDVLNTLGRNVYASLMSHLPVLTEKYVSARLQHDQKGLGQRVKSTLTQQSLAKIAENNPVLKQQLDEISSGLLSKFPDASPDWVAEKTRDYFVQVAKALGANITDPEEVKGQTKDTNDLSKRPDFNWADYLTK